MAARTNRRRQRNDATLDNFVAIILAHGRPDSCHTFHTLRRCGYTGRIIVLIDNEDSTRAKYEANFGAENVVVFDKQEAHTRFRNADNFNNKRAVVYARNVSFEVAQSIGFRYFMQLDDDYLRLTFRADGAGRYIRHVEIKNMDAVVSAMLDFYSTSPCLSLAFSQEGDHLGGAPSGYFTNGWPLRRKAMNSWLCDTTKPFSFEGCMNEDVSTYVRMGVTGSLFFTFFQVMLTQVATQGAQGGMSETYAASGTYVKSFYTVMMQPSSVRVSEIGGTVDTMRLHHRIDWKKTAPKILREKHRKK